MKYSVLQSRFLLLGIIPNIILISAVSCYFITPSFINIENALIDKSQITIEKIAFASTAYIASADTTALNKIAKNLLNQADIVSVNFRDNKGSFLISLQQATLPPEDMLLTFQQNISFSPLSILEQVNFTQATLGTIEIKLSLENTRKKQAIYLFNHLVFIVFGLTVTTLLAIYHNKNISQLINNLNKTIIHLKQSTVSLNKATDLTSNHNKVPSVISEAQIPNNQVVEDTIRLEQKTNQPVSIFIADDNEINRLLLKSQLEPYCQNITIAIDGKTALTYLQKYKYDLILLDLQMPFFSGQQLIKIIKQADEINEDSPTIAITAYAQNNQRQELIDHGFDECLIKPITLEQIMVILDLWLPELTSKDNRNIETVDYVAKLLEKTSGNIELATTIFKKIFSELPKQMLLIKQALDKNDFSLAQNTTHKLHGSVSFCGFSDIKQLAQTLEASLSTSGPTLINSNYQQLKDKVDNFISLQEMLLAQLKTTRNK